MGFSERVAGWGEGGEGEVGAGVGEVEMFYLPGKAFISSSCPAFCKGIVKVIKSAPLCLHSARGCM